jgi:hypothetical protein
MLRTKAGVLSSMSLDPDDEGNGRFEGSVISSILRRRSMSLASRDTDTSTFPRMSIRKGCAPPTLSQIDFDELGDLLQPLLKDKRLFLSACSMVHEDMAEYIIPKTVCFSVMGPCMDGSPLARGSASFGFAGWCGHVSDL